MLTQKLANPNTCYLLAPIANYQHDLRHTFQALLLLSILMLRCCIVETNRESFL